MTHSPHSPVIGLERLDSRSPEYASQFVAKVLEAAVAARASDVHLHPVEQGLEIRWRVDGVLQSLGVFPRGRSADVVARLKVLADLLTYQTDVPQEGRLREAPAGYEMRVSTFPTLYGERVAVRIFAGRTGYTYLPDLGFPDDLLRELQADLSQTSGALIVAGPAGSGKTTTIYACLRELVRSERGLKSVVTLEDPIESVIAGVAQSQVKPAAGFTLASGLRSLLRQDPEVILVGEIRDFETAEAVFQAALTGHLVLTTFHAGNAAEAVGRLLEMGIEPYSLRSGLRGVLSQRLLRRLCDCKAVAPSDDALLGLPVSRDSTKVAGECAACFATGYHGRVVVGEFLSGKSEILSGDRLRRRDVRELEQAAAASGTTTLLQRAVALVASGITSPAEVVRVFGLPQR